MLEVFGDDKRPISNMVCTGYETTEVFNVILVSQKLSSYNPNCHFLVSFTPSNSLGPPKSIHSQFLPRIKELTLKIQYGLPPSPALPIFFCDPAIEWMLQEHQSQCPKFTLANMV